MNSAGDFVVAWASNGQDTSSYGVFARRFNSFGGALGRTSRSTPTSRARSRRQRSVSTPPGLRRRLAQLRPGRGTERVFARRFNSAGTALAGEFQVTHVTLNSQRYPAVAMAGSGGFIVAWESLGQDGDGYAIFARRFNSSGAAQAAEFLANSLTAKRSSSPRPR